MEAIFDTCAGTLASSSSKAFEFAVYRSAVPTVSVLHYPATLALTVDGVVGEKLLRELGTLEDDWDGYGAASINAEIISQALDAFAFFCRNGFAPEINPNPHGTISFEWTSAKGKADLEIGTRDCSFYLKPVFGEPLYFRNVLSHDQRELVKSLVNDKLFPSSRLTTSIGNYSIGSMGDWL